jgi:hypothetical protein
MSVVSLSQLSAAYHADQATPRRLPPATQPTAEWWVEDRYHSLG